MKSLSKYALVLLLGLSLSSCTSSVLGTDEDDLIIKPPPPPPPPPPGSTVVATDTTAWLGA